MPKQATKAADNEFYKARIAASKCNDRLASREGASEELGIDRTRLARIELGRNSPSEAKTPSTNGCTTITTTSEASSRTRLPISDLLKSPSRSCSYSRPRAERITPKGAAFCGTLTATGTSNGASKR